MALTRKFEGYSETWTKNGGNGTVVYSGPWSTRTADNIIGSKHPDPTISDQLIATSTTIEPWGDASDAGTGGPLTARHTVTYEDPTTSLTTSSDVTDAEDPTSVLSDWIEQWEAGGEAITVGSGFIWSDTGSKVNKEEVSAVKLFPTATITMTGNTNKFSTGAKTKVLNCVGKVNKTAMSIKGHSYAAEHLLFLGLAANQTGSSLTSDVYQLSPKWAYRHDNTWNEFWRQPSLLNPFEPGFAVMLDGDDNGPYLTASFSDIDPKNW